MSSRDLHTQAAYQLMMLARASPSYARLASSLRKSFLPPAVPGALFLPPLCSANSGHSYGIFRLTNPPGLQHIIQCQHSDTFHQHSIDNLYRDAENPRVMYTRQIGWNSTFMTCGRSSTRRLLQPLGQASGDPTAGEQAASQRQQERRTNNGLENRPPNASGSWGGPPLSRGALG